MLTYPVFIKKIKLLYWIFQTDTYCSQPSQNLLHKSQTVASTKLWACESQSIQLGPVKSLFFFFSWTRSLSLSEWRDPTQGQNSKTRRRTAISVSIHRTVQIGLKRQMARQRTLPFSWPNGDTSLAIIKIKLLLKRNPIPFSSTFVPSWKPSEGLGFPPASSSKP